MVQRRAVQQLSRSALRRVSLSFHSVNEARSRVRIDQSLVAVIGTLELIPHSEKGKNP